jgi:hypothetical protein
MHASNGFHLRRRQLRFDMSQDSVLLGVGFQRLTLKRLQHGKQNLGLL